MAFRMVIDYEGGSWQPDVDGTFSQDAFAYRLSAWKPARCARWSSG